MKLVRYLQEAKLLKATKEKQANGTFINTYNDVEIYKVHANTLNDSVSATIYGSNVVNMLSVSTALGDLESLLQTKTNNKEDNISLYFIEINGSKYKINSVSKKSLVIEKI